MIEFIQMVICKVNCKLNHNSIYNVQYLDRETLDIHMVLSVWFSQLHFFPRSFTSSLNGGKFKVFDVLDGALKGLI